MNNIKKNTQNTKNIQNIVYKKTSDYDNDSSTYNSQVDLDESVITIDDNYNINNYKSNNQNFKIHENNINLRDNINKELIKNININIPDYNNDDNIHEYNNDCDKDKINNSIDIENKYINDFIHYIKINNYGIESVEDINLFKELINFNFKLDKEINSSLLIKINFPLNINLIKICLS